MFEIRRRFLLVPLFRSLFPDPLVLAAYEFPFSVPLRVTVIGFPPALLLRSLYLEVLVLVPCGVPFHSPLSVTVPIPPRLGSLRVPY